MDIFNPQYRESIIAMDGEILRPRVRTPAQATVLTAASEVAMFKNNAVDEYYFFPFVRTYEGRLLHFKEIDTGVWDMDATPSVNVAHGLSADAIFGVIGWVINDALTRRYPFPGGGGAGVGTREIWADYWDNTNVVVARRTGGFFDHTDFNDPTTIRGYITILYWI